MDILYDYVFHFNPYTKLWNAVPRDAYSAYWSDREVKGVLKSKNINTLLELVQRGDDFINSIE